MSGIQRVDYLPPKGTPGIINVPPVEDLRVSLMADPDFQKMIADCVDKLVFPKKVPAVQVPEWLVKILKFLRVPVIYVTKGNN